MPLFQLRLRSLPAVELIAALLILVLVYAAATQLSHPLVFEGALRQMPWLRSAADPLSRLLPIVEFSLALMLFFQRLRATAFLTVFLLLLLFSIYIALLMLFVPHLPCSCFLSSRLSWGGHLVLALLLSLTACAGHRLSQAPSP